MKRPIRRRTNVCEVTGRTFTYLSSGQKPRVYVTDDAKWLRYQLKDLAVRLKNLNRDAPLTREARRRLRAQLQDLQNHAALSLSKKRYPSATIDQT